VTLSNLIGTAAGFLVALTGFVLLGFASGVSAVSIAAQDSYVGGIEAGSGNGPPPDGHDDLINNPYALEGSHYSQSPAESWLNAIGVIAVALLGGATAARVGRPVRAWRGALAVASATICLVVWAELRCPTSSSCIEPTAFAIPFVSIVAAIGGIGGLAVRRFVKVET
jgi:hypothetical protein